MTRRLQLYVDGLFNDGKSIVGVSIFYVDYDHVRNVVLYRLHSIYQIQVFNENFNRSNELERFVLLVISFSLLGMSKSSL